MNNHTVLIQVIGGNVARIRSTTSSPSSPALQPQFRFMSEFLGQRGHVLGIDIRSGLQTMTSNGRSGPNRRRTDPIRRVRSRPPRSCRSRLIAGNLQRLGGNVRGTIPPPPGNGTDWQSRYRRCRSTDRGHARHPVRRQIQGSKRSAINSAIGERGISTRSNRRGSAARKTRILVSDRLPAGVIRPAHAELSMTLLAFGSVYQPGVEIFVGPVPGQRQCVDAIRDNGPRPARSRNRGRSKDRFAGTRCSPSGQNP